MYIHNINLMQLDFYLKLFETSTCINPLHVFEISIFYYVVDSVEYSSVSCLAKAQILFKIGTQKESRVLFKKRVKF